MAQVYPFSQRTAARLADPPAAGGTHRWLAQVASGVSHVLTPAKCFEFLRRCCDVHVAHRRVPDREIEAAVEFAFAAGEAGQPEANYGRQPLDWPEANPDLIAKVISTVDPLFDGVTSTRLSPAAVLPALFSPGDLVCTGPDQMTATVRPVEEAIRDADRLQFICVNPMRGLLGITHTGHPSARCQSNVRIRRFLVAEFDNPALAKANQAQLATALADAAPLALAVDSGGKSVHAWYHVEHMARQDQARFFVLCCLLGADRTRWDVSGWLRMPGGLRAKPDGTLARQKILYWNPATPGQERKP